MSQYMYESDLFVLDTKPLSDLLFKASNAYATDFEKVLIYTIIYLLSLLTLNNRTLIPHPT